jgi:hypothetical protein
MLMAQDVGGVNFYPHNSPQGSNLRTRPQWLEAILYSGQVTRVSQHLALVLYHVAGDKGVAALSMRELQTITGWGASTIHKHLSEIQDFIHVTFGTGRGKTRFELQMAITEVVEAMRSVPQVNTTVNKTDTVPEKNATPNTTVNTKPSVPDVNPTVNTSTRSVPQVNTKPEMGGTIGGETNNYRKPERSEEEKEAANAAHRAAFELSEKLKGGKVAKSARAVQSIQGELDGSKGITFEYGKLIVVNGALGSLEADFPGINLQAVFNKVGTEVAKIKYPTMEQAMALIRKWAQFAVEDAAKAPTGRSASKSVPATDDRSDRIMRRAAEREAEQKGRRQ